jgi:predicted transcriptional regulator
MEDSLAGLAKPTSAIVAAFVGNNSISRDDLPALIGTVHNALRMAGEPEAATPIATTKRTPAQIRRSITPDALISFEDGRAYRTLKRHLNTRGMSLAEYKAKWGLPRDYPTTAPNYSAMRSQMAKAIGLGQMRGQVAKPAAVSKTKAKPRTTGAAAAPARRARPNKAADAPS